MMPFFTKASTAPGRVLAPLGLEAIGQRIIAQRVFPGITGGLVHPQYFSFMSWVVATYEDARRNGRTTGSFSSWRRRLEHAWRVCSRFATPDIQALIGIQRTELLRDLPDSASVEVDADISAHAFQAATYGASLGLVGLAETAPRRAPRVTTAGRELAAAFDAALRAGIDGRTRRVLNSLLSGATTFRAQELRALSEHLFLRDLAPGEPEFEPVLGVLVTAQNRLPSTWKDAQRRARGFGLLLSVIESATPPINGSDELLKILWMLSEDDDAFDFPEIRESWRAYGERQEIKTAVVAFWYVILRQIEREQPLALPGDNIIQRCMDTLRRSNVLSSLDATALGSLQWGTFVARVTEGRHYGQKILRRKRFDLVRKTRSSDESVTTPYRLGNALVLLAASAGCWNDDPRSQRASVSVLHGGQGGGRIAIPWLARQLDERRNQTIAEVVDWFVGRCILQQALLVGNAKTPYGTKLVVTREAGGFTLVNGIPPANPFEFDANRLSGAVALLGGLSLINTTGTWSLTAKGRQTLRACRTVTASELA